MSADAGSAAGGPIAVEVVYSPQAGVADSVALRLPAGSCVADALRHSGLGSRHPALLSGEFKVGVWGRLCSPEHRLREADRVEVYRPLLIDPKDARRKRQRDHRQQKAAKATGSRCP